MAAVRELQGREKMVQAQHWPATPPAPAAVAPDKADKKRQRKPKIAEASVLAVVEAVSNTVVKEEPASEEPQVLTYAGVLCCARCVCLYLLW